MAISPMENCSSILVPHQTPVRRKTGRKAQWAWTPGPLLEEYAGIWLFDANKLNQRKADGKRYATGIRNAVSLDWNTASNTLYALQHGRDMLNSWGACLLTR